MRWGAAADKEKAARQTRAKLPAECGCSGQKKSPPRMGRTLSLGHGRAFRRGAHSARQPASRKHDSTAGAGSQAPACPSSSTGLKPAAAPGGLGLDPVLSWESGRAGGTQHRARRGEPPPEAVGGAAHWNSLTPPRSPQRGRRGREGRRGEPNGHRAPPAAPQHQCQYPNEPGRLDTNSAPAAPLAGAAGGLLSPRRGRNA